MAVANSSYMLSDLGIKNSVHKQKLRLKALDIVLFGFNGWFSEILNRNLEPILLSGLNYCAKNQSSLSHIFNSPEEISETRESFQAVIHPGLKILLYQS